MILRVIRDGDQGFGDGGALRERQDGKRGSKLAANNRGRFRLGEFRQGRHVSRPLLGDQAHRPSAECRLGIIQCRRQYSVVQMVGGL